MRGTTLDVAHRVTLAHELTHVLQDQHFDLTKLQKQACASDTGDPAAFKALVEGDAVRIQHDYLQAALDRGPEGVRPRERRRGQARQEGDRVGSRHRRPARRRAVRVRDRRRSRVLIASGGNDAVNDALTGPTPSSAVFVAGRRLSTPSVAVDAPLPSADGVAVGRPEPFGPFEMYLTLSHAARPAARARWPPTSSAAARRSRSGATASRATASSSIRRPSTAARSSSDAVQRLGARPGAHECRHGGRPRRLHRVRSRAKPSRIRRSRGFDDGGRAPEHSHRSSRSTAAKASTISGDSRALLRPRVRRRARRGAAGPRDRRRQADGRRRTRRSGRSARTSAVTCRDDPDSGLP